jgi:hypothetical protein
MDSSQNEKSWANFVSLFKYSTVAVFGSALVLMLLLG